MGRQGPGSYLSFASWLFSAGGKLVDFKTGEVFINDAHAVTALQFYVDLMLKHKVVPPEAMTWEFDEIIAGGQNDRYAMTQTFAPYGTLINDPQPSKTASPKVVRFALEHRFHYPMLADPRYPAHLSG